MTADAEIIALWRKCESDTRDAVNLMLPPTDRVTLDRVFKTLTKLRNASAAMQEIERRMNGSKGERG
jgi:hypothetical protein